MTKSDLAASVLKNIVNNIPYYVFWKDINHRFLGCNKNFAMEFGFDCPEKVIGKTDKDFLWLGRLSQKYNNDDDEVIKTTIPKLSYEEEQTRPDGSVKIVLASKVPLFDASQKIIGVLGVYTDITERKKMEQQLRESIEKAESTNRAKTEFLLAIVNELREEVLGKEKTPSKQLLSRLVNDIEQFARYDLNKDSSLLESVERVPSRLAVTKKQINSNDLLRAHKMLGLSKRESECAYYLTRGMTMKLIAKTMDLSPRTVEFYIENIKDKLSCNSRSELIAKMFEEGLV